MMGDRIIQSDSEESHIEARRLKLEAACLPTQANTQASREEKNHKLSATVFSLQPPPMNSPRIQRLLPAYCLL